MLEKSILKKQLLYRSANRGCKETDLLIGQFAKLHIDELSDSELNDLAILLDQQDLDVYNWLTRQTEIPQEFNGTLMQKLLKFNYIECI